LVEKSIPVLSEGEKNYINDYVEQIMKYRRIYSDEPEPVLGADERSFSADNIVPLIRGLMPQGNDFVRPPNHEYHFTYDGLIDNRIRCDAYQGNAKNVKREYSYLPRDLPLEVPFSAIYTEKRIFEQQEAHKDFELDMKKAKEKNK